MTAVLVAWNAGPSLAACIDALRESARVAAEPLQIVIVDNASGDRAIESVDLSPGDIIVRNPLNAGYGVAAAQGIARAGSPWVLLVNPDVVVEPAFVGALLRAADQAAPHVATLVPELRFAARPDVVNCRGLTVDEIGVPAEVDAGRRYDDRPAPMTPILGGSSGCSLLRTAHVVELGGPEPGFFAYLEDVDLALRLCRAGYATAFVPEAVALHEGSASTGAQSPLKSFLVARSRRMLFRLHGPRSVQARAWRTLVEIGHASYAMRYTPAAPWSGRIHALALRPYVDYLRRSRAAHDDDVAAPKLAPRVGLRDTLSRKRAVLRSVEPARPADRGARTKE
jgi:GT2 family glycosyltransferase